MKEQRKTEIKVGIVSILSLALLILGITLGKDFSVGVSQITITMEFPRSGGIAPSAPVVVNGVKRGAVSQVRNHNGNVRITAEIDDISDFRTDAAAMITMMEITGGKKIDISPGNSPDKFTKDMIIPGKTAADLSDLVTMIGEISGDAKSLMHKFDTTLSAVNYLLADRKTLDRLDQAIINADKSLALLAEMLQENRGNIRQSLTDLNAITTDVRGLVDRNGVHVDSLIVRLDRATSDIDALMATANSTLEGADTLMTNLNAIAGDLRTGDGIVSRLIYDEKFNARLDSMLTEFYIFIHQVRRYGINTNVLIGHQP